MGALLFWTQVPKGGNCPAPGPPTDEINGKEPKQISNHDSQHEDDPGLVADDLEPGDEDVDAR